MENKIYLYGASGHCKVIIDILIGNGHSIQAILDDNPKSKSLYDIPVTQPQNLGVSDKLIVSIGNNKTRKKIVSRMISSFSTAIHRSAIISKSAHIGAGSVIMAGVVINPDASIGRHCIINTAAIIEHDAIIADYVHVSPGVSLAGNVTVGEGTHIGIGAVILQGIIIGKWATIGAGAVIIKNIPDYAVIVGVPGKIIKYNDHE